jgi:hypothetical protein
MSSEEPRVGWWSRMNTPLSDHAANLVSSIGLLAFGLSGFIDQADGRPFSMWKVASLAAGLISLAVVIWMRVRK